MYVGRLGRGGYGALSGHLRAGEWQAGPKLRKWYGAGERLTDGGPEEEPEEPEEQAPTGDAVLVTDADGGVGEQVVLQLILARQELKLLVKDVAAAKNAYGPYTTPLPAEAVAGLTDAGRGGGGAPATGSAQEQQEAIAAAVAALPEDA
eukprot:XP_001701177.1 predicted protein [Chlamydomonas reinhardtii]